jgi:hypothetical protein
MAPPAVKEFKVRTSDSSYQPQAAAGDERKRVKKTVSPVAIVCLERLCCFFSCSSGPCALTWTLVHFSTWLALAPALSVYILGRRTILASTLHPTQLPAIINDSRATADI